MKRKKIISFICIVVLAGLYFLCEPKQILQYEENVNRITEMSDAEQQEMVNRIVEEGQININYQIGAIFKGRTSESFNVKNNPNNRSSLIFELIDEAGNIFYTSKMIRPGYEINKIKLDKLLSKGVHQCSIKMGYEEGNVSSVFPITIQVK